MNRFILIQLVWYCLKTTSQTNDYLSSYRARTRTRPESRNALNLSLYSYVESISKLGSRRKPICGWICLCTCIPWGYFLWRRSFLLTVYGNLDWYAYSKRTRYTRYAFINRKKVACVCDVVFEQYHKYWSMCQYINTSDHCASIASYSVLFNA